MTLGPKKKRRKKLLIILSHRGYDAILLMLCQIWPIYEHADTSQLTPAELNVTDEVDALYLIADPSDDPDNFDACASDPKMGDGADLQTAIDAL